MTPEEIAGEYEHATGLVIAETVRGTATEVPAVLVRSHGPFTWGSSAEEAAVNASVLEEVACMAWRTLAINPAAAPMQRELLDRHYLRKHGKNAYYGQT